MRSLFSLNPAIENNLPQGWCNLGMAIKGFSIGETRFENKNHLGRDYGYLGRLQPVGSHISGRDRKRITVPK